MEKPLVVMLGHQAHVGKDTLGEFLIENDSFVRFGFADKLKNTVADLYGFNDEHMYGSLKNVVDERYGVTPREILQDFGQEQRERFPDIWADYVFRSIANKIEHGNKLVDAQLAVPETFKRFVITDFRFPNEHTVALRYAKELDLNIITIKIFRPDEERGEFAGSTNISETALNNFQFDLELLNSTARGKEDLYNRFRRGVLETGPAQVIKIDTNTFL